MIETEFPVKSVSKVGSKERYLHGKTAHSLFTWWARRPFSAMRAVVLTSLIPMTEVMRDKEIKNLVETLSSYISPPTELIEKARSVLINIYGHPPRVLDIFGGGGTIALEAGRVGCESYSIDVNPLAYFIQKFILEYSQVRHDLPELVGKFGKKLLDKLKNETQKLYCRNSSSDPFEQRLVFLWGRTIRCANPECGKLISLSGNWFVSKKTGKKVLLVEEVDKVSGTYKRELIYNPKGNNLPVTWKPILGISCPFCGRKYSKNDLQKMAHVELGDELLCVRIVKGYIKKYILPLPLENFYPPQNEVERHIQQDLCLIGDSLPKIELPRWSGIVNPSLYGAKYHADLFNPRQLAVLLKVIRALRELYIELINDSFSQKEALAIISALSGFIDQLVDWNCRLSMWIEENEQVGRALSGPGIPMFWRYAEIDPFAPGPANLYDKLNRIVNALKFIPKFSAPMHVYMTSATSLPFNDRYFDAVITDPAYGDNLFYSVLSECIYVWKRMVFKDLLPEIFNPPGVSYNNEIVAPTYKYAFPEAMKFYEDNLTLALKEAKRVLKPTGIISLFFTHSTLEAWELIIRSFRNAGFRIVAFWPILIERMARPRGMKSEVVNVSVVIVARHKDETIYARSWEDLSHEIDETISSFSQEFTSLGWKERDIAWGCFARSVGVMARYDVILDEANNSLSLQELIRRCADHVGKKIPSLSLKTRPSNAKLKAH